VKLKYKIKDKEEVYSVKHEYRDKPSIKIEIDGEIILLTEDIDIENINLDFNH